MSKETQVCCCYLSQGLSLIVGAASASEALIGNPDGVRIAYDLWYGVIALVVYMVACHRGDSIQKAIIVAEMRTASEEARTSTKTPEAIDLKMLGGRGNLV